MIGDSNSITAQDIERNIQFLIDNPKRKFYFARKRHIQNDTSSYSIPDPIERYTGIINRLWGASQNVNRYWNPQAARDGIDNPQACSNTSYGLLAQNMFSHKYLNSLSNFKEFIEGLQDKEPGLFNICSIAYDHVMVLVKYRENGTNKYRLVQSYISQYDLKQFIHERDKDNKFSYNNYKDLQERFLKPLKIVLFKPENANCFGDQMAKKQEALQKLTDVDHDISKLMTPFETFEPYNEAEEFKPEMGISLCRTSNTTNGKPYQGFWNVRFLLPQSSLPLCVKFEKCWLAPTLTFDAGEIPVTSKLITESATHFLFKIEKAGMPLKTKGFVAAAAITLGVAAGLYAKAKL